MKIDNKRNTYKIWLRRLVLAIFFTLAIIIILLTPWFNNPEGALTKYHLIVAIALAYIIVSLFNYLKVPYFVFYSDGGEMLILRYYSLSIFNQKKNSIEIPKKHFVKFEVKKFFFGLQEKIIIYQNYRNKIAMYPPISMSAVDKPDRERIKNSLRKYSDESAK